MSPYVSEHACRIREPSEFQADSFRRIVQGKLSIIIGRLKGQDTTTAQAYRYPISKWTPSEARQHCQEKGGSFHAATKKMDTQETVKMLMIDISLAVQDLRANIKKQKPPSWIEPAEESTEKKDYWSTDDGITVRLNFLGQDIAWKTYNDVTYATFKELGADWVEWVTEIDEVTCDYCDSQSGRRYHLGQFMPWCPAHPNCRCSLDYLVEEG